MRQNQSVLESTSPDEQTRFLSILSFWHKLEFFIPFDLDQRIDEAEEYKIRYLERGDLSFDHLEFWHAQVKEDEEVTGFHLYLCIFDKSEITRVCNRVLGASYDASNDITNDDEDFERIELEGRSCFAQLTLSPTGELILNSKSKPGPVSFVSTLPWALGQIQKGGLATLTSEGFQNAKQNLAELLLNFKASRKLPTEQEPEQWAKALICSDILELQALFEDWAGFVSAANPIGILKTNAKKTKEVKDPEELGKVDESTAAGEQAEPDIAILNSFFIDDIESAMKSIKSGYCNRSLRSYLLPLPHTEQVDLESTSGLQVILDTLHPARRNCGRWFSNPDQPMTLMQQFAINSVLQDSDQAPALFSVNGPPGTGKTTLLKDIFADLIVRRARVLASLKKPRDAFLPKPRQVSFIGGKSWRISIVRPELTGFEMVVASSNNAAVENISGDLPKAGKLGSGFAQASYLKSIAYKIAAQQEDDSCKRLAKSDEPWGLISCALGNSKNRTRFKERFFYHQVPEEQRASWQTKDCPSTITEWIDGYQGPSFAAAVDQFRKKDAEVLRTRARVAQLADLLYDHLTSNDAETVSTARILVDECRAERSACESKEQAASKRVERLHVSLKELVEEERLLRLSRPEWWARLRRTGEAKLHKIQVSENASAQLRVRRELSDFRAEPDAESGSSLTELTEKLGRLEAEWEQAKSERSARDHRSQTQRSAFAALHLPEKLDDLQADNFQMSGLWHDEVSAQQGSELFQAALSLHEAWLASVGGRKEGFLPNIFAIASLLSGARLENPSDALAIWQSLFLMVPIVSTTFASFQSQFANIGPASLGWLFIDKAGQAVPQAAVGAIWRAKRAVVIGDPLQIEPVFTLPSRFISALAELSPHTISGAYSPDKTSVQRLADDANKFGVTLGKESSQEIWVGSPLRVHRRCIEPMFSWSNAIAYDGKMVFGLPNRSKPDGSPISCESTWIDIKGGVSKRQNVPEQTQFVLELIVALYQKEGKLPSLYVISPFRAMKAEIISGILTLDWVNGGQKSDAPKKNELEKWCREHVGTVHTFQGKEEDSVLMILGADSQHEGSADWACSKPNILNVALTRARRRFYVVGDRNLWGHKGPFAWFMNRLPTVSARLFLAHAQGDIALTTSAGS